VALANRFEGIAAGRVSERDGAVFREFLRAVAPTVLTCPTDACSLACWSEPVPIARMSLRLYLAGV
jgi:hypothetical protein